METSASVDLGQVARELNLSAEAVERTVALLDEGNTVAFITRFRKDHTGGLDEEQVRGIESRVGKLRQLAERKHTIRKSIESQHKLTPELDALLDAAQSNKRLEDLYLPYKPKKQTHTNAARERGLQPLADEILRQDPAAADLDRRTADFVDADKGIGSVAEVLQGVGHLIAEHFSEHAELRGKLRKILWRTGKLTTAQVPPPKEPEEPVAPASETQPAATPAQPEQAPTADVPETKQAEEASAQQVSPPATEQVSPEKPTEVTPAESPAATETPSENVPSESAPSTAASGETVAASQQSTEAEADSAQSGGSEPATAGEQSPAETSSAETPVAEPITAEQASTEETPATEAADKPASEAATSSSEEPPAVAPAAEAAAAESSPAVMPAVASKTAPESKKPAKEKKKKKKKPKQTDAFKDYYDFTEALTRLPPHRVMAINRGERAKAIRVRIDSDDSAIATEAEQLLIDEGHIHADFLRSCLRDALTRLVMPSLQREARRELTEKAEDHAIEVFAQNLRKLLLQPPLRGRRVLAIDPGFRSGCKIAVVDAFGEVLDHATVHVVGREERRKSGRSLLVGLIKKYSVSVVAIGNGAASREAEQLVSGVINEELKEFDVSFVIVNEAGASIYSTSPVGREEFPKYDPTVRSAISIARRLLDPLSELVKISPAHIGVGMYQHDVKSKHLRETLDAVVASCVNYVGVDANTASPSLLKYVSGLNQLHARRIYEHRQEHGPYRRREQIQNAPHIGEATYQQAAGFLKIPGGEHPLDVTWIHPESYDLAEKVLAKVDVSLDDLSLKLSPEATAYGLDSGKQPVEETPPAEPTTASESATAEQPTSEAASESASQTAPSVTSEQPAPAAPTGEQAESEAAPATEAATSEQASAETPAETGTAETESVESEPSTAEAPSGEQTPAAETSPADTAAAENSAPEATPAEAPPQEQAPAAETSTAEASTPETSNDETPPATSESTSTESPPDDALPRPPVPKPKSEVEQQAEQRAAARAAWEAALTEQRAKFEALAEKVSSLNVAELAQELDVGELSLKYLLRAITRPGRDPRDDLPQPVLRRGILKLEDLQNGMELTGSVLNVVDFGAFVDIGLTDSGLVHISRLADRYVSDPHEVVSVGDVIQVWVMEVDTKRRRVSLTAIKPGTEKSKGERGRGRGKQGAEGGAGGSSRPGQAAKGGKRGDRKGKGRRDQQRSSQHRAYVVEAKPKESKPLKKKVLEGKEPMRSFSDLVQFLDKKEEPPADKNKKKK